MVVNDEYVLIDFANGGMLNFTYDLMLQNFYFTNSKTWKHFHKLNFKTNNDPDIFFGTSSYFFKSLETTYGIYLDEEDIKLSLIIALSEIFIKNYHRYQSKEEWSDGIGMFEAIEINCKHIMESACAQ